MLFTVWKCCSYNQTASFCWLSSVLRNVYECNGKQSIAVLYIWNQHIILCYETLGSLLALPQQTDVTEARLELVDKLGGQFYSVKASLCGGCLLPVSSSTWSNRTFSLKQTFAEVNFLKYSSHKASVSRGSRKLPTSKSVTSRKSGTVYRSTALLYFINTRLCFCQNVRKSGNALLIGCNGFSAFCYKEHFFPRNIWNDYL